jgi:hypothetical protein
MLFSCWRPRKPVGRAGGYKMGRALSARDNHTIRPSSRGEFTAVSAEICAQSGLNQRIRLSSAGPRHETTQSEGPRHTK